MTFQFSLAESAELFQAHPSILSSEERSKKAEFVL